MKQLTERDINMKSESILKVSTLAGSILLKSGAEIVRVEETITHMCESYDVEDANAFVTPSGIFVSFSKDNKTYSKVIRIKGSSLDLEKINQVNQLSRECKNHGKDIDDALQILKAIEKQQSYPKHIKIIASGFIAMFFTYFFGGNFIDGLCAFPIGALVQLLSGWFDKNAINSIVKITCLSSILTLITLILVYFHISLNRDSMIIGNLMLLVPGVAITNAIRDSISGDLLSGITKGIEACLIAIALALGAGVTISLWMSCIGGI